MKERPVAPGPPETPEPGDLDLAKAVVLASPEPLVLLGGDLTVTAISRSFLEAFQLDDVAAVGAPFLTLGGGVWNIPQLRSLLRTTASGAAAVEAYETDLHLPGRGVRRLVVRAQSLRYADDGPVRLLVAVNDITDARANEKLKDDALQQNLILLQEVRHRVANSLQIIASVLLQNARRTRSDETRGHLKDAHNRVMSVAALERQLAGTGDRAVELHAYFTTLCESISASMITDDHRLSLAVTGQEGLIDGRVSVSLGLIVTELVINALKHAFPNGRAGHIVVDFEFRGLNWTLSVADDGVGMPVDPAKIRTGLGTSIVAALAQQLGAVVETRPAQPGTRVTITHSHIALLIDGEHPLALDGVRDRPAA